MFNQDFLISTLIDEFLVYVRYEQPKPVSAQTFETHKKRFKTYKELLGEKDVRTLQPSDISLIRVQMIERGCKFTYVGTFLGLMRSFLKWCKEEKGLEVMDYSKIKYPKGKMPDPQYLDEKQLHVFLSAINVQDPFELRFMAALAGFLDTGMRISELLSIDRNQIDWNTGEQFITGKGGKVRLIKFHPWSLSWIKRYVDTRSDECPALFVTHNPQVETKRLVPEDLRRYFRVIAKRAGLGRIIPHMMRKTFATNYKKNGGDIRDIQKWLGHSRISTTERYLGVDWEELKKSHEMYVNYHLVEEVNIGTKTSFWSKNGKWAKCVACDKDEREHVAKGLCDRCYMRRRRKAMLKAIY